MKYYKSISGEIFAYEDDVSQDEWISTSLVAMTPVEVDAHINPKPTADEVKGIIARRRYTAEISGLQWNGFRIATDRDSQAKIDQADRAAMKGLRVDGDVWKCLDSSGAIVFRPTTNAEMSEIAAKVFTYVQACFAREGMLVSVLADGTFTDAMLEEGWPANE